MTSDKQTKARCQQALQGDLEAGNALLNHFHQPLYAYLRRLSGSDADAADLTQQTFRTVWQVLNKSRGASSGKTWVHRIVY